MSAVKGPKVGHPLNEGWAGKGARAGKRVVVLRRFLKKDRWLVLAVSPGTVNYQTMAVNEIGRIVSGITSFSYWASAYEDFLARKA